MHYHINLDNVKMKNILIFCVLLFLLNVGISQNDDIGNNSSWELPIYSTYNYESLYIQRNDTIFYLNIYPNKSKQDSIVCSSYAIKIGKKKWKTNMKDGSYSIIQCRKIKPSIWFEENKGKYFQANSEYELQRVKKIFLSNGDIIQYSYFFNRVHVRYRKEK